MMRLLDLAMISPSPTGEVGCLYKSDAHADPVLRAL
jgi:hypothetical protein